MMNILLCFLIKKNAYCKKEMPFERNSTGGNMRETDSLRGSCDDANSGGLYLGGIIR
jgi:hypothetical protein